MGARWQGRPFRRPAWATNERLAVIVAAAVTSAAVSQFTLWMGNDSTTRGSEAGAPTGAGMRAPLRGAESPVALALAVDRVSPHRSSPTTPAPAVQTPPAVASSPRILAEHDGVPQEAMLPQDRPVLMDARIAAGTTGLAAPYTVPMVSLASGRERPAVPRGDRANGGENSRENRVVPRSAAVPAGLVVITQPEGARVTINGVGWGMTPLTIGHLPPGAKRVRITMPGYRSEERVVATDPERPAATLRIALREVAEERPPH
jgi:PEGA domain